MRRGVALLGQLAGSVDITEILSAVGVDDDARVERRHLVAFPQEEVFSIALERDFDEVRHYSKNCPMRRNLSRRRRTSLSGL